LPTSVKSHACAPEPVLPVAAKLNGQTYQFVFDGQKAYKPGMLLLLFAAVGPAVFI